MTDSLHSMGDTRLGCSTIINPGLTPAQVDSEKAQTANPTARRHARPASAFGEGAALTLCTLHRCVSTHMRAAVSRQLHSSKPHLHKPLLVHHQGGSPAPLAQLSLCKRNRISCIKEKKPSNDPCSDFIVTLPCQDKNTDHILKAARHTSAGASNKKREKKKKKIKQAVEQLHLRKEKYLLRKRSYRTTIALYQEYQVLHAWTSASRTNPELKQHEDT